MYSIPIINMVTLPPNGGFIRLCLSIMWVAPMCIAGCARSYRSPLCVQPGHAPLGNAHNSSGHHGRTVCREPCMYTCVSGPADYNRIPPCPLTRALFTCVFYNHAHVLSNRIHHHHVRDWHGRIDCHIRRILLRRTLHR